MARFESAGQIVGLFVCASLVAVGVIFVLNLEAAKRYAKDTSSASEDFNQPGIMNRLVSELKSIIRRKREIAFNEEPEFNEDLEIILQIEDTTEKSEINSVSDLSEGLLTESLNGRKLRDVSGKVSKLDPVHDEIVAEILRQFCQQREESFENVPYQGKNESGINLQFSESQTELTICQKDEDTYGTMALVVIMTTVVNFSLVAIVLICKAMCVNCWEEVDDDESQPPFCAGSYCPASSDPVSDEFVDDEDLFAISGLDLNDKSPIIKNSANIAI